MSDDKSFVPVVLDREISSIDADAFGHRHFAQLMQGLIESSRNEPPYSIGLLGRWGSGKSSIKSLYLSALSDDASSSSHRAPRSKRIRPITFNAWRLGGEDIKRALLRHVYLELDGSKDKLDEALFKHVQRSQPEPHSWRVILREAVEQWGWGILQAALVIILLVGAAIVVGKIFGVKDDQVIGWMLGASVVVAVPIIRFVPYRAIGKPDAVGARLVCELDDAEQLLERVALMGQHTGRTVRREERAVEVEDQEECRDAHLAGFEHHQASPVPQVLGEPTLRLFQFEADDLRLLRLNLVQVLNAPPTAADAFLVLGVHSSSISRYI